MEGSTYSGRHVQWAGGTYWEGGRWVKGEAGGGDSPPSHTSFWAPRYFIHLLYLCSDATGYDFSQLKPEPSWVLIRVEPRLAESIVPASTSTPRFRGPELSRYLSRGFFDGSQDAVQPHLPPIRRWSVLL